MNASAVAPVRELKRTAIGEFEIQSEHSGAGAPIVLLHGLSGSRRWWRYNEPILARSYRVHVPELVGFGGSRAGRQPKVPEMAAVVAAWLDRMGVEPFAIIGHSMGGQIAVHLAVEQRVPDRLVLAAPSGVPRPISLRAAAQLVAGALPPRRWGAPTFIPTIALDAMRAGPRSLVRATQYLLSDDVRPLLPRITCPTLVLWGALDPLVPVAHGEVFGREIPNARLVVLADAAHNLMADRPPEFNRILLDFLAAP
jgi:pimeloyl-ACP methyl ester carboxylesterase